MKISKDYLQNKRDPHLHSPAHVLADELSQKLGEPKNFAFYLKAALSTNPAVLRGIAGQVLESNSKNPGALFSFLLKKHNKESSSSNDVYSIWLMPSAESNVVLEKVLKTFAAQASTPIYKPHLTLAASNDADEDQVFKKFEELAGQVSKMELDSGPLSTEDSYFKAIYLLLEKPKELIAAKRLAKNIFQERPEKFFPHITLAYGNITDIQKVEMIRNLTITLPTKISFEKIALVKTNQAEASQWKKINEVNLQ